MPVYRLRSTHHNPDGSVDVTAIAYGASTNTVG